jgi:hypothetical protein
MLAGALSGVALGGFTLPKPAAAKKKKHCPVKCRKDQRCKHGACVTTCSPSGTCDPADPNSGPPSCGNPADECGCVTTIDLKPACLQTASPTSDACDAPACKRDKDCPKGQVCGLAPNCCPGKASLCAKPCPSA